MTQKIDPLTQSHINAIYSVPDHVMQQQEREYYSYLLTLMPIESSNVDKLRENHITIMSGVTSLQYVIRMRKEAFEQQFAPVKAAVEDAASTDSKYKLTVEKLATIVAAHPDCRPFVESIKLCDALIDHLKRTFELLDHRMRMLAEKSYQHRHDLGRD